MKFGKFLYRDRNTGIWDEVSISVTGVSPASFHNLKRLRLRFLTMLCLISSLLLHLWFTTLGFNLSILHKFITQSWYCPSLQPVKLIDPHLVSSFFDNYNKVYLHATTELENRSSSVAECSLSIQVCTEVEESFCVIDQLQTQQVLISPGARVQYTFPQVRYCWSKIGEGQ